MNKNLQHIALRKIKRGDWTIDHLPSGYYLKRGMNKAAAKKLLQQLKKFQFSCRKPILADDVLEELKKVVESFS